ncbi:MAG: amidohydrolase family protein [Alphaproteobacteria bacterium]|nr:amidohydrolase family protein [Alphaproteobacteria bacterium]
MKNILLSCVSLCITILAIGQANIYPQTKTEKLLIKNITIHQGNGKVLEKTDIFCEGGKIVKIGANLSYPDVQNIDGEHQHLYPGFILPASDVGLKEIGSGVRGSNDFFEIGENNADIKSIVAYNAESAIINVLRSNGILFSHIVPEGNLIGGLSSAVQFDAWNYEDAVIKKDLGLNIYLPSYVSSAGRRGGFAPTSNNQNDIVKKNQEDLETIRSFFQAAKSYHEQKTKPITNLKLEAVKGLFNQSLTVFFYADELRQILYAIDLVKDFGIKGVIVGGAESYLVAPILAAEGIAVIYNNPHALPATEDGDVDLAYKTPALLKNAGVLVALNDNNETTRYLNLSFLAGTAAAYGLTKEEALSTISLNPAKILGLDKELGSIEEGKSASFIVANGDVLDMKSAQIIHAFIDGRKINLNNVQKELNEKYKHRYGF